MPPPIATKPQLERDHVLVPQAGENGPPLFRLQDVRKTYGLRRVGPEVFAECLLPAEDQPSGPDWRAACGTYEKCLACVRRWSMHVEELEIAAGKVTFLLGHSGSGKSTMLNLLAMLDRADGDAGLFELNYRSPTGRAQARFDGKQWIQDGRPISANRLRRLLFGFVFQAGHLVASLTAAENVALALAIAGRPKAEIQAKTQSLLESVKLPSRRYGALPRHLSGGEYQRIAIARALAHDPQVVFADEPTGNLDPDIGQTCMELLREWCHASPERTLICVSHNLSYAKTYGDEVIILNGGRVALDGDQADYDEQHMERVLSARSQPQPTPDHQEVPHA